MPEKPASVVDQIRKALAEGGEKAEGGGGGMPSELFFVAKDGVKVVRFLTEFNAATAIKMHDWFGHFYPQPCFKYYNKVCPFCKASNSNIKTNTWYAWTVYDYESQSKRLAMFKTTLASPLEDLVEIYDANEQTILDRDITIKRSSSGEGKTHYRARAKNPSEFTGKFKKPFTEEKIFQILQGTIKIVAVPAEEAAPSEEE